MKWKVTIIGTILLLLSSCVSTNQFLSMGGANGTKENLPVGIEVLLEMAEYCERVYDEGKEIVFKIFNDRSKRGLTNFFSTHSEIFLNNCSSQTVNLKDFENA